MSKPMVHIGQYNLLKVREQLRHGCLLGDPAASVLLPAAQVPEGLTPGDSIRVFVFQDGGPVLQGSVKPPLAVLGEFAFLQCRAVTEHGAFVDWGLPKDLFVPFAEQYRRMEAGRKYVVHVGWDGRGERIIGSSKLAPFFDYDLSELQVGDPVDLLVFGVGELGAQVVVDQRYTGMVYTDATFRRMQVGEALTGYIANLRKDNRLDITLSPPHTQTAAQRDDAQQVILAALTAADGFLPLHDKSSPAAIEQALGLSKKVFKRAVGGLYKARKLRIEPDGLHLRQAPSEQGSDAEGDT